MFFANSILGCVNWGTYSVALSTDSENQIGNPVTPKVRAYLELWDKRLFSVRERERERVKHLSQRSYDARQVRNVISYLPVYYL